MFYTMTLKDPCRPFGLHIMRVPATTTKVGHKKVGHKKVGHKKVGHILVS